ncbi:MAG: hypothetical protein FJ405_10630 [Verrucomicrobia bacterium]|nr:hypothetical protein [Verrucomicrobiota bacterium]
MNMILPDGNSESQIRLFFAGMFFFLITSCTQAPNQSAGSSEQSRHGIVSQNLPLIEGVPPKIGEPHFDRHALAILSEGKLAAPFLMESVTNASPSRVIHIFEYAIGDLAHRLLCEIYHKPFLWPVAEAKPIGDHPEVSFLDYLAFVNSPGGREKLRFLWLGTSK